MKKYEKRVWIKVLDLYKNHPHLWDRKNVNYMNKNMRQESFLMLLDVYKEIDEEASVESLKSKIMNLRTCFLRELKKVKKYEAATQTGRGTPYVPTLWYYDYMMFLSGTSKSLRGSSDTFKETVYKEEDFSQSESDDSDDTYTVIKKKPRQTIIKEENSPISSVKETVTKKEEKWEILAKFIAVQLQDVDDDQLTIANKLISDAIFYAKTGKLTVNSTISLD